MSTAAGVALTAAEAERIAALNSAIEILLHAAVVVAQSGDCHHSRLAAYALIEKAEREIALDFASATHCIAYHFPAYWDRAHLDEAGAA